MAVGAVASGSPKGKMPRGSEGCTPSGHKSRQEEWAVFRGNGMTRHQKSYKAKNNKAQSNFSPKWVTCGTLVSSFVFSGHKGQQLVVSGKGDLCLGPGTKESSFLFLLVQGRHPSDFAMPTP